MQLARISRALRVLVACLLAASRLRDFWLQADVPLVQRTCGAVIVQAGAAASPQRREYHPPLGLATAATLMMAGPRGSGPRQLRLKVEAMRASDRWPQQQGARTSMLF